MINGNWSGREMEMLGCEEILGTENRIGINMKARPWETENYT